MAFSDDEPRQLDLVEAAEANPLLRRVDALCDARAWDDLVQLARRCREAYERGKQLWPIAEHIDYRLALEAPPAYAASVLTPAAGRFAFGPLTEVAASTHTFDELEPHLPTPQVAGVVAAERVLRGEVLAGRPEAHAEVLELPMCIEAWEPSYPLATYRSHEIEAPSPEVGQLSAEGRGAAAGRSAAWWAAAELAGLDWPPDPAELAAEIAHLRWHRWEPPELTGGWNLHLAVEDPEEGWSAAIAAEDRSEAGS